MELFDDNTNKEQIKVKAKKAQSLLAAQKAKDKEEKEVVPFTSPRDLVNAINSIFSEGPKGH